MSTLSTEGKKFIAALLSEGDSGKYINLGNIGEVFTHFPDDNDYFEYVQDFFREYGKLPELKTFNEETGLKLKKTKETPDFFYDLLLERHVRKTMIKSAEAANDCLKENDVDEAYEIMKKAFDKLALQESSPHIIDFKMSHDMLKHELIEKTKEGYGINTGWEYFDFMNDSVRPGDLISICGRTGLGKTWLLLFIAMYVWETQKKPVLFFSMEMDPILIMERLSAMYQHIPYNRVKRGEFPTLGKDKKKEFLDNMLKLADSDMPSFNVVGGNLKTNVTDIVHLANQLRPSVVFVDGAYMVQTDQGFAKYERIGNVANTLKRDIASSLGIPVFASWQFNKDVTKLKKGQRAGTEHIGGADEIGNVSSVVMGLFEEESAKTIKQRRVEIVKGRGGESGEFFINWDFKRMDFSQVEEIGDYKVMVT